MEQINYLQSELGELKDSLYHSLEQMMIREESLEELNQKTEKLVEHSAEFKQKSTSVKENLWWINNKTKVIIGAVTGSTAATAVLLFMML